MIEYDIDTHPDKAREMREKSPGKGIPFIDIEGIYLRGFSESSIRRAVEERRSL